MESSHCRCKNSSNSSWLTGSVKTASSHQDQFKPYPVQASNSMQQNFETGLICQPGSVKSPAPLQPPSFHDAVSSLKLEKIEEHLRNDPSLVHQKGFNGQVPLHRACLRGDPAIVEQLLRYKADPNATDDFSETPLHFACKRANLVIIHKLIQNGANLLAEDRAGKGVLHHAAHGGSVLMAHYLLEICHMNPFVCDRNVSTPMHIVCMHGHVEAFHYFLRKERCDPFSKDAQGNTLLHVAASNGNGLMCWRLLEHSGYRLLREVNGEGCTALDLAKRGSQPKYAEIVQMLSYYSRRPEKTGPINGPLLAWYGLFLLPILMFPVTLLLASCFVNQGPVTLIGVLLLLALRGFHSHRINHVSRWPSPAHAGMFAAGMFYSVFCLFWQLLPYFYADHVLIVFLSIVLTVTMIYMYLVLLHKDPGVIKGPMEKPDMGLCSTADIAMGQLHAERFCTICEIIPPPMSSHCRLCDKCYERVDHHCLYLYRCIAANNHRIFVFFNAVVLVSMILFEYACFLYVTTIYPQHEFNWTLAMVIFTSNPVVWSLFVLNAFSIIWGVWLIRVQLLTIAKGQVLAYQPYYAHSNLTAKERIMNIVRFVLNEEPCISYDVCDA